ncbi:MAG TPA: LuxR C-terminal-related transcriptional regulator [Rubrobacter sp.]|nr:LuxR C-terminal-related transcriptional regulator [Rubrobacter sp.]
MPGTEGLSEEEKRVLELFVQWRTTQQISAELAVSQDRVREHVQSILDKLEVHSRLEAIRRLGGWIGHSEP